MGLFTWIKGLLQPQEDTIRCQTMPLAKWEATRRRRGSNPPCGGGEITRAEWNAMRTTFTEGTMQRGNGDGGTVTPKPPIKPQPTGGRLIYGDRDPGPVNQSAPAPAEMPSDELMEQWKRAAIAEYLNDAESTWRTAALLAFAEGRRQAQFPQLPPPGADPVATTENLWDLWASVFWADTGAGHPDARRALYNRGRADERAAIAKELGVEP